MIKKLTPTLPLALALMLTACGTSGQQPVQPGAKQQAADASADPGVGHVHGLGVDPATGRTYVAGHFGLFALEGGKLSRVGDRDADHMGFTVAGPGTFYASGHPSAADIGAGQAPHLGLIRSSDAGRTWEQVALAGAADFHALQVAGSTVYGYDSQTGQIWRGRGRDLEPAARLDLLDLAAGASEPERLYATTPAGVRVSTDAGRTFKPVQTAPLLSFLDVTGRGRLAGIAPDGQVHTSSDGAATWRPAGRLPMQAVAFTAVSADHLLAAAMDGTVYESKNAGQDFTVVHRP
ncbi:exo-alpha-sialidase [Nonomuraea sp. NN258]|uniref:F510_1955 family glycosylhydrolase n=1 Tax=Nonomuraea antri TaxID=2730852 RepID=UPI0015689642|nr:exo-alpha-sialidase [Nonomuraea antri]NRQ39913.1 exo-alpha-sialidase [Nonomuraea antri]